MLKRIIAMLMAIVLLVGNVPVQAFATEEQTQETTACITEGCTFGAGHTGECSTFVACGTEGCTYASGHEGNCSNYVAPAEPQADPAADADITVTVSDRGQLAVALEEVTVSDIDADGALSLDEALYALHTAFGKGYASENGTVTKLWDVDTSNVSFFLDHNVVSEDVSAETVSSGDYLVVSVDQDADYDKYSRFSPEEKTVKVNETFTLTLTDDAGNALAGMEIGLWNGDGSTSMTGLTTDVSGTVSLSLDREGLYCITARGTVVETAIDMNTMEQTSIEAPIVAPVCIVTVSGVAQQEAALWSGRQDTAAASAAQPTADLGSVRVIVENTTYPVSEGAPWEGTLVDVNIDLTEDMTMMTAVLKALDAFGYTWNYESDDWSTTYIGSIEKDGDRLGEFTGGDMSGWMGTLNGWFVDMGFTDWKVSDGTLAAGDVIRIMFTRDMGADIGGGWESPREGYLSSLSIDAGTLDPAFSKETTAYTLTVESGVVSVNVSAEAENKGEKVVVTAHGTEYRRGQNVPVSDGTVITVTCGEKTYTVTVTVAGPAEVPVAGISLDRSQLTLTEGESDTLTATVTPGDATDKTITWSSGNNAVAQVVNGTVTAVAPGTATITAAAGGYTATCEVTVVAPQYVPDDNDVVIYSDNTWPSADGYISEIGVKDAKGIASYSWSEVYGQNVGVFVLMDATKYEDMTTFSTYYLTDGATVPEVEARSEDADRNDILSLDVIMPGNSAEWWNGMRTIYYMAGNNYISATFVPAVYTLNKTALEIEVDATEKLIASLTYYSGSSNWTSSDTAVATVASDGTVTAVGSGTVTITASVGTFTATCEVTVTAAEPEASVTLSATELNLSSLAGSAELTASVTPSSAEVTWATTDAEVADIFVYGGICYVSAIAPGECDITATADGVIATCHVTVTDPDVEFAFTVTVDGDDVNPVADGTEVGAFQFRVPRYVLTVPADAKTMHLSYDHDTIRVIPNGDRDLEIETDGSECDIDLTQGYDYLFLMGSNNDSYQLHIEYAEPEEPAEPTYPFTLKVGGELVEVAYVGVNATNCSMYGYTTHDAAITLPVGTKTVTAEGVNALVRVFTDHSDRTKYTQVTPGDPKDITVQGLETLCILDATNSVTYHVSLEFAPCEFHAWTDATCSAPKTCSICGTTEGEVDADAHSYVDGTCEHCGEAEPEAVQIITGAYLDAEGQQALNVTKAEEDLNVNLPWGAVYTMPLYQIQVPAGTEYIYVSYPESVTIQNVADYYKDGDLVDGQMNMTETTPMLKMPMADVLGTGKIALFYNGDWSEWIVAIEFQEGEASEPDVPDEPVATASLTVIAGGQSAQVKTVENEQGQNWYFVSIGNVALEVSGTEANPLTSASDAKTYAEFSVENGTAKMSLSDVSTFALAEVPMIPSEYLQSGTEVVYAVSFTLRDSLGTSGGNYGFLFIEFTCDHVWSDATCTAPKTCVNCGMTEGETVPGAHAFESGACIYCGTTEGAPVPFSQKITLPSNGDSTWGFVSGLTLSGTNGGIYEAYWSSDKNPTFVLDVILNQDTDPDAQITAEFTTGSQIGSGYAPTISGETTVTLVDGKGAIQVTAKSWNSAIYPNTNWTINLTVDDGTAASRPTYTVQLPTDTVGYTVTAYNSESPVIEGRKFSFKVTIDSEYKKGENFKVLVNGEEITGSGDTYIITDITADQVVTVEGVEIKSLADKNVTIIAPAGSTVSSGRFYSYFKYDFNEPVETTTLDDGRLQFVFPVPGSQGFLRVQHPQGVTYWDFDGLTAGSRFEITEAMLFIGSGDFTRETVYHNFEKNVKDKADLYLTANEKGWLDLSSGETWNLNVFRNFLSLGNSISNTYVALPDVEYKILTLSGANVITVTPDAYNSSYAEIRAENPGTAIILVSYDAVYNNDGEGGKQWSAIWPENTGVIVVTVDSATGGITTNMTVNEEANGTGKQVIDAEHDILFYVGSSGASYSFKPESGCTVTVNRSSVGSTMTFGSFTGSGVEVAEDGTVTVTGLTTGAHIIRVEKNGSAVYQVVRARQVSYELKHSDGSAVTSDSPAEPGETVTVQYHDLISPMEKLSGVYNTNFSFYYNGEDGAQIRSDPGTGYGVYDFSGNETRQKFTVAIPATWQEGTYTILDGAIKLGGFGSSAGAHRTTTYIAGKEVNTNASGVSGVLSVLPDISIPVNAENGAQIDTTIRKDIFDSAIDGTEWGRSGQAYVDKLTLIGAEVVNIRWEDDECYVSLAPDTAADADLGFEIAYAAPDMPSWIENLSATFNGEAFVPEEMAALTLENGQATAEVYVIYGTLERYSGTKTFHIAIAEKVVAVEQVTLDKTSLELEIGATETLTATVTPADATDATVSWTSSNLAVARVIDGTITAVAPGTATITAAAADKSAECVVTVKEAAQPAEGLDIVTNDAVEGNFDIRVSNIHLSAAGEVITNTVSNDGKVAVQLTEDVQSLDITLTMFAKKGMVLTKGAVAVNGGTHEELENVDQDNNVATWTTTVTPEWTDGEMEITFTVGMCTSTSWKNEKNYVLTLKQADDGSGDEIAVESITLDKSAITLAAGETETLTATVMPENATDKTVVWTSSNTAVATVVDGVVTAVAAGEATITAAAADKSAECVVTVEEAAQPAEGLDIVTNDSLEGSFEIRASNIHLSAAGQVISNTANTDGKITVQLAEAVETLDITLTMFAKKGMVLTKGAVAVNGGTPEELENVDQDNNVATWTTTVTPEWTDGAMEITLTVGMRTSTNWKSEKNYVLTLKQADDGSADKAAAKEVSDQITAIGEVTLESEEAITAAREAYDALTDTQKAYVENYETLTAAETTLAALKAEAADKATAKEVSDQITAIGEVTQESEEAINAAREAYDALTEAQKAYVENYETLTAAETTLAALKAEAADKAAANNVINLIEAIGEVTEDSAEEIETARAAYDALTDAQKALVTNLEVLEEAEEVLELLNRVPSNIAEIYTTTGNYLAGKTLTMSQTNGDWAALGLARSGRTVAESYYEAVAAAVKADRLHEVKSTENARVILALTAIGKDVTNVNGYDLVAGLNEMSYVTKQGLNGPIWVLIALDSYEYEPAGDVTREKLIQTILDKQLSDGGWSLSSKSDVDMTAMAIQALAPYYKSNASAKAAVDKALTWLSEAQHNDGSFGSVDGSNAESTAQVIVALTALGVDPDEDSRFIKNGITTVQALAQFYVQGGGFEHTAGTGRNDMATEQSYYALAAYARFKSEQTALYDMADVTIETSAGNQAAADAVIALINAIGTVDLTKEDEITAARTAYNALTDAQKALISASTLKKLTDAETELAQLKQTDADSEAANAVKELIDAIGTVTLEKENAITTARNAYNRLTTLQKNLVGATYLTKLTTAEAELAALKKAAADEAAASAVEQKIAAIGTNITLGSESKITTARNAYNALTADQKALVSNYQTLVNAENALSVLKSTVCVTFSLKGCYKHGSGETSVHTLSGGNLQTWITAKTYKVQPGATVKDLFEKALSDAGLEWKNPTGNYVESIKYNGDWIGEFTNGQKSGWMYTLNGKHPNLGVAQQTLVNGDVVVFHYTDDYTKEEGSTSSSTTGSTTGTTSGTVSGSTNYITTTTTTVNTETAESVDRLIEDIGEEITLESEAKILAARAAYDKLTEAQKKLVEKYDLLVAAEAKLAELKGASGESENAYIVTGDYIQGLGTPGVGAIGGEWMVIGLARSGRPVPSGYYDHVVNYVRENINNEERLHSAKSSDNSRVILGLTAIGKDVTNVDGHDLLKGLNSMDYIQKQGINGPIWALIAFDSGNYPVPAGDVSREKLIEVILEAQLDDGGWAMSGERSDPDMTGMAIQALAPYMDSNAEVKKAVETAVWTLSKIQNDNGSFSSVDGPSSESIAQVIVALAALGIDADTDARFVKNGISALDALLTYFVPGGGFRHVLDGNLDGMGTEQAYYALVAYNRMKQNQNFLYDMTDVIDRGGDVVVEETTEPTELPTEPVEEEEEDNGNAIVIWTGVMTLCAGAIVVILLNRKKLFGKFL